MKKRGHSIVITVRRIIWFRNWWETFRYGVLEGRIVDRWIWYRQLRPVEFLALSWYVMAMEKFQAYVRHWKENQDSVCGEVNSVWHLDDLTLSLRKVKHCPFCAEQRSSNHPQIASVPESGHWVCSYICVSVCPLLSRIYNVHWSDRGCRSWRRWFWSKTPPRSLWGYFLLFALDSPLPVKHPSGRHLCLQLSVW